MDPEILHTKFKRCVYDIVGQIAGTVDLCEIIGTGILFEFILSEATPLRLIAEL